jgi:hypothetical protein
MIKRLDRSFRCTNSGIRWLFKPYCLLWLGKVSHLRVNQHTCHLGQWCSREKMGVLKWACGAFWHMSHCPDIFIWGHHYKQWIPRHVGKYELQQLNNDLSLQLDVACVHFAHTVHDCSHMNSPGRWIRRRPITWSPCSYLMTLDFFLWGYEKDQAYKDWIHCWSQSNGSLQQYPVLQRTCYS